MAAPLTPDQIAIVKATVPVLQQHGSAITTVFYNNLFSDIPSLRNIFSKTSQDTMRQPRALANAVLAYASHVDNLPALAAAVERIAHKHVSLQVSAPQYDIVGQYLIQAIGQVLGDAATPPIVDAWTAAYTALATVFIGREAQMYKANAADGWEGWRRFRVVRRVAETPSVTSFYLSPSDATARLPAFLPGQYVSLQINVPALGYLQSRQYSLSEAHCEERGYYRISVKRDEGEKPDAPGIISNLLHDEYAVGTEVELSHPQGEFFVDPYDKTKEGVPAVLISAGVGATPLMAILGALTTEGGKGKETVRRPVSWIQAARSSGEQPFAEAVRKVCRENENVSAHVFLRNVGPEDRCGVEYRFGDTRLDLAKLDGEQDLFLGDARSEYFVCGPEAFMVDVRRRLVERGVAKERVHLELFATGDVNDE